jgi:hypothetical protein
MEVSAALLLAEFGREIPVLQWPGQRDERDVLARQELPRLLLVEAGDAPPEGSSCLEDWIRLPADPDDIRARLAALRVRASRHRPTPTVDEFGQFSWRDVSVQLSPTEERLATALVAQFGHAVRDADLLASGWPDGGGNARSLRVQLSRMRRRLAPLGLEIRSARGAGHLLRHSNPTS